MAATTGSCAAAAAKAASLYATQGSPGSHVDVPLPDGGRIAVELLAWGGSRNRPWASVRKPWTDDPDATRGVVVVASLQPSSEISFRAGTGVGTVTRAGLQLPVGEPAINPGPRGQIAAALAETGRGTWCVTISVLGGEAVALRTFNPRLGILGGISILGTAGLVRPWSTQAFLGSVEAHLGVVRAKGQARLLLVPGHMGEKAASRLFPELEAVEVGNAWGEVVDRLAGHGFEELVALGHPGKLLKLVQGQWDTHSSGGSTASAWARRFLLRTLPQVAVPLAGENIPQTMEGLLALLEPGLRTLAASLLAGRVARSLARRSGLPTRVLLIDLGGALLGEGNI
jgi:cobalt-precorrin-5B (C1)-methyltransferase